MSRIRVVGLSALLSVAVLVGCEHSEPLKSGPAPRAGTGRGVAADVTAERLRNAASEPSQWMTYGGNYEEHRFSRLKQIDKTTLSTRPRLVRRLRHESPADRHSALHRWRDLRVDRLEQGLRVRR